MKVMIYYDPFKRYNPQSVVEILEVHEPLKKLNRLSSNEEVASYHLYNTYGLKKALVRYPDGSIMDNIFFDQFDEIKG